MKVLKYIFVSVLVIIVLGIINSDDDSQIPFYQEDTQYLEHKMTFDEKSYHIDSVIGDRISNLHKECRYSLTQNHSTKRRNNVNKRNSLFRIKSQTAFMSQSNGCNKNYTQYLHTHNDNNKVKQIKFNTISKFAPKKHNFITQNVFNNMKADGLPPTGDELDDIDNPSGQVPLHGDFTCLSILLLAYSVYKKKVSNKDKH